MKKFIICTLAALVLNSVRAEECAYLPDDELFASQREEDIIGVRHLAKKSASVTQLLFSGFAISQPDEFIIYRIPYHTVAFARWGERHAVIRPWDNTQGGSYREISVKQWRSVYKTIAKHVQQPPAKPKMSVPNWTPGYAGIVHVRDQRKVRDYLLSTAEIYKHHHRGPIQSYLCRNFIPHCGSSHWTSSGWILKLDEQLQKAPQSLAFERNNALCNKVSAQQFNEAELLLVNGADINGWLRNGNTCYAELHKPQFVKSRAWLIEHNASITKPDFLGRLPTL